MLEAAEEYALSIGCHRISITVISVRTALIEWYERRGYVRTGEVIPFHAHEKFGIPNMPLELVVLEKRL